MNWRLFIIFNENLLSKSVFIVALLLSSYASFATHAVGIDIAYECLGGNEYRFTLNFYRDCEGISAPSSASISISSASCGISTSVSLPLVSSVEVSPICPSQFNNSACSGGNLPGIEQYVYAGNHTLPANCNDWVIGYSLCCRNNAITNLSSPGSQNIYAQATLDNTNGLCNNSPVFTTLPVPYLCANQDFNYNHGAVDIDGDSLVYTLINSQDGPGINIPYNSGFSPTNPLATNSGFNFDNNTGQMSFNAQSSQQAVVTVLVKEYRNGVLIGSTIRDLQLVVLNCSNIVPTATGIDGTTDFSIDICAGFPLCFDIFTNDADAGQTTTLTWNNGIQGATFTVTGSPFQEGEFCWTPTPGDVGPNNFSVTVVDDACPIPGNNTYTYTINVIPNPNPPIRVEPDTVCVGECVQLDELNRPPGVTYEWTPSLELSDPNIPNPVACPSVTTVFTLSATYPDACVASDQVQVTVQPNPTVDIFPATSIVCAGSSVQLTAITDPGSTFDWSTGDVTSNVTITPSSDTIIHVEVENSYGCTATDSASITYSPPPPPQVCNNVYVTPNGNGGGLSSDDPTDLLTAISLAQCNNLTIKMAKGTYIIDNPISVSSLLTIEGGYDNTNPNNWIKSSQAGATTISRSNLNPEGPPNAQRLVAIYANGANFLRLQDLTIRTADATPTSQEGMSTYGLHMTACANYDIVRCQIIAGNATDGAQGSSGNPGNPGANGGNASDRTGGTGACGSTGCGGNGGRGGSGGFLSGSDGQDGQQGQNGGGLPGSGGNGGAICANGFIILTGTSPSPGQDGSDGTTPGVAGSAGPNGVFNNGFFEPGGQGGSGTQGSGGLPGGGGGGAGGATFTDGGGGGGGGAGGEGGLGGSGGYGGGGSFPLYLFNNGPNGNVVNCNLIAGTSGNGGVGGVGGPGGAGGMGGTGSTSGCDSTPSGDGGNGGTGAAGGSGGAGAAGLSQAVAADGGNPLVTSDISFDLVNQPIINVENISCANTPIDFSTGNAGNWDFGTDATPQNPNGTLVTTNFSQIGRKDINYNGAIYTGFHNIAIDNGTFLPEISSTANQISVSPDTFLVCFGDVEDFNSSTPAINYAWDFGGAVTPNTYNTQNVTGLTFTTAGTFTITLMVETDCCGWSVPNDVVLIVEPAANIQLSGDSMLCPGESTIIDLSGATSFYWTPNIGTISDSVASIPLNPTETTSYLITGYSPTGNCEAYKLLTVYVNDNPMLNTNSTDATCTNDGEATVTVTNGTGSYDYLWDDPNNQNTSTAMNLAAGNYNVTVTDLGTGCLDSAFVNVGTSGPLAYIQNSTNVTCFGDNNGSATAAGTGGMMPYTFEWDDGTVGAVNNGLGAGEYEVTLTDDANCMSTVTAYISQPDSLFIIANALDLILCSGSTTIFATADGGNGGYEIEWFSDPAFTMSLGRSDTLFNISSGSYYAQVKDENECKAFDSLKIIGPPVVNATVSDSVLCFGSTVGSAFASASGGGGSYSYEWFSDPALTMTIGQSDSLLNISSGSYYVEVTDNNGCSSVDTAVIAGSPSFLTLDTMVQDPKCAGGNDGQIIVLGSSGLFYQWDTDPVQNDSIADGLEAGTYRVDISDAYGCDTFLTATLFDPDPVSVSVTPTDTIIGFADSIQLFTTYTASGEELFTWTPPVAIDCPSCQNPTVGPFEPTTYWVILTDKNGCTDSAKAFIDVDDYDKSLYVPNAFTPNDDGTNDIFYVYGRGIRSIYFQVYDRWGEKLFESYEQKVGWDGTYKGEPMLPGVYVYYVQAVYVDNDTRRLKGSVTLIR